MNISPNSNKALNSARAKAVAQKKTAKKAVRQQLTAKLKAAMNAYTQSESQLEQDNIQRDVVTLLSSNEIADSAYFKKVKGRVGQIFTKNRSAWESNYAAKSKLPDNDQEHLQSFREQIKSTPLTAKSFFNRADVKKLKSLVSLRDQRRLGESQDEDDPSLDIEIDNILYYGTDPSLDKKNPKSPKSPNFNAVG